MRGFLKCYYGYQNLGDEVLFFGMLDYIDSAYRHIDHLTVEVGDIERMQSWRDRNLDFLRQLSLAPGFISGAKKLHFVALSKNPLDNLAYDLYFFGGGEVFADSRGFHGGRNYLLRYPLPLLRKRFVLLGGIESATTWRQKLLYRLVLPRAQRVVCREQTSYHEVKHYTDKAIYLQDFALTVVDSYTRTIASPKLQHFRITKPYVLINMVQSVATDENFEKIRIFLTQHFAHTTPVYVAGSSSNSDDKKYASWLEGAYNNVHYFDRTAYDLAELLALFANARAGIGARLHILLLLQAFDKDRYSFSYAQKIDKLIISTLPL